MLLLSSAGESFFQLLIILFIFVGVLAVTFYTTKWIAGYQKSHTFNRNLEVIETLKITPNKYIQIVRTGKDTYQVIAIGKDEIVSLGTLSEEQLFETTDLQERSSAPGVDFKNILDKVLKNNPKA
ncbi:MAG: flagellar biosynthetic protein FliO [Pseudobutyrivibrio sp.]|nr:flagellar biosynthetic protein FliO [Pseudobutyrivibrio sp.]